MTATAVPTTPASLRPTPDPAPARRAAAVLVFALMLAALVGRFVFLAWEPPFDGAVHFDDIRPLGDAYWTMNIALGGPSFALTWITAAISMVLLARGRSSAVTVAAAVLAGLGGVLFSLVITAEVLPFAYAADADAFTEAEGRALFDTFNAQLAMLVPLIVGTQAVIAVGMLVFLVTALVTRAVPRWFAIAGLAYLVAFAVVPFDQLPRDVTFVSEIVQTAIIAGVGWFGMRAVVRPR